LILARFVYKWGFMFQTHLGSHGKFAVFLRQPIHFLTCKMPVVWIEEMIIGITPEKTRSYDTVACRMMVAWFLSQTQKTRRTIQAIFR
jgi:hypothetical protein